MTSSLHDLALRAASIYAPLTEVYAERVRALAARSLSDPDIGRELGLSKKQVERIRRVNNIDAGAPGGGQSSSRPVPEVPLCDRPRSMADPDSANGRWVAALEAAGPRTRGAMRRAVCRVLGVSADTSDLAMICAAQQDPRTAEELACAYLLAYGRAA